MINSSFLLSLKLLLLLLSNTFFPSSLFYNYIEYVLTNVLMVTNKVSFHRRDPFVLSCWQITETNFPKQSPNWIILVNQSITVKSIIMLTIPDRRSLFLIRVNFFTGLRQQKSSNLICFQRIGTQHTINMPQSLILAVKGIIYLCYP